MWSSVVPFKRNSIHIHMVSDGVPSLFIIFQTKTLTGNSELLVTEFGAVSSFQSYFEIKFHRIWDWNRVFKPVDWISTYCNQELGLYNTKLSRCGYVLIITIPLNIEHFGLLTTYSCMEWKNNQVGKKE